jgi:RNA polymerase sigma factor (sigma-70 family)
LKNLKVSPAAGHYLTDNVARGPDVARRPLGRLIRHIRTLGDAAPADPSDAQLLERFAARRDEGAFTALLERHGPMVFGVCRRVLRHDQDAEDAFQATFLVLARKAGSRGWRDSVGAWLHAVAQRVALKARTLAARRHVRLTEVVDDVAAEPARESPWHELRPILDEELNRLPEKYRAPLVLCYLEGKTNEEAARLLGRPVGTVWYQLSRGRELLRGRLSRRGVGLPAVALGAVITRNATAAVPEALLALTRQASLAGAGPAGVAGPLAQPVATLVKEVLHDMLLTKLKRAVAMVLVLCVAGLGAGAVVSLAKSGSEPLPPNHQFVAHADVTTATPVQKTEQEKEKEKDQGKTEPEGAPLEARLVAKQDTYTLDRGGKSAEEYAQQVRDAAKRGAPLPTPRVELTLELRNTGDKEIKILVGGDGSDVMLDLQGPGAVSVQLLTPSTLEYRASDIVAIAPGKSHVLPLSNLSFGHRVTSDLAYWTKPGDYTLTATYHTAISPTPKGAQKAPSFLPDFGHVAATSAPIKLKVIEKK